MGVRRKGGSGKGGSEGNVGSLIDPDFREMDMQVVTQIVNTPGYDLSKGLFVKTYYDTLGEALVRQPDLDPTLLRTVLEYKKIEGGSAYDDYVFWYRQSATPARLELLDLAIVQMMVRKMKGPAE